MELIFEIWERFDRSSAVEMSYSSNDFNLVLKKGTATGGCMEVSPVASFTPVKSESVAQVSDVTYVNAPIAGIFYRSPSPDEKPFVMIGDEVKTGQVLGIVEAMKMMNEVTSPIDGVIEAIIGTDNEMIDYDGALFAIAKKQG
ncbi:MAG: acetyl-CoA carboxylase biotin carboxyl carrier protein subunit [Pseudobutyrivibrio sp.]|nr:acetyl-CoA carboxylase biotin carboxyl carrier protein subunit [Pseudobutyrivibrio sp.]